MGLLCGTHVLDAVADYFLRLGVDVGFDASDAASAGETTDRGFVLGGVRYAVDWIDGAVWVWARLT